MPFKNKNIIEFFASEEAEGLPEIYPNYKSFPEWFPKTKKQKESKCPLSPLLNLRPGNQGTARQVSNDPYLLVKESTVHNCPGIVDYLKTGYIMPAWIDMAFRRIHGEIRFESSMHSPELDYSCHQAGQFSGMDAAEMPTMNMFHKVSSPWWVKTPPGISVLITNPYWNRNKNFTSVSAIVHPDITPIHLKWFFEFNKSLKDTAEIYDEELQIIKKGTPLALIIPFRREEYEYKINYLEETKIKSIHRSSYYGSISWYGETLYNSFRKKLGNLYR